MPIRAPIESARETTAQRPLRRGPPRKPWTPDEGESMQDDEVTKLGSYRAKLLSTSFNEKLVCVIFSMVAVIILLLSFWYSYMQFDNVEYVVHLFAVAAQCAGALVLLLEVFGESEEKQLRRMIGTPLLHGQYPVDKVPVEIVRIKASEIASKKASAITLLIGYAAALAANAPEPSIEALLAFVFTTAGLVLAVQSFAVWKMLKFQGESMSIDEFYDKEK